MRFKAVFIFLIFFSCFLHAEKLEYKYPPGYKYRILSEVEEDIYLNSKFSSTSRMLNKISVEIIDTDNNVGLMHATSEMSEQFKDKISTYEITEVYESYFMQDSQGFTEVDDIYFVPMVRDVPVFPAGELKPGDTWEAEGKEVHDFRKSFNIPQPYSFPILVQYEYLGKDENGFDIITMNYSVKHQSPPPKTHAPGGYYLAGVIGKTSQVMKWDNKNGRPSSYNEEFDFVFVLSTGDQIEFIGKASAYVIEAEEFDTEKAVKDAQESIESSDVEDVYVEKVTGGIKIRVENLQFLPDSTKLADSEDAKLAKIIEILKQNPGRDILITGHTAHRGTEDGRKLLSLRRAKAIAEYIVSSGARTEKQIRVMGKGSSEPVVSNDTEEGRKRNRRVEITVYEN